MRKGRYIPKRRVQSRGMSAEEAIAWIHSKIDKSGGPYACWPWTLGSTSQGYGRVTYEGQTWFVHRLIFLIEYKLPLDSSSQVLHKNMCHNRLCCNYVEHLYAGTPADNMLDTIALGILNGNNAALSKDQVYAIRALLLEGKTLSDIAARFGVHRTAIWKIKVGITWGWLK